MLQQVIDSPAYVEASFAADWIGSDHAVFKGVHNPSVVYGGWYAPLLPKDEADRYCALELIHRRVNGDPSPSTHYDSARDVYVVPENEDAQQDALIIEPVVVNGQKFYDFGETGWVWDLVE